MPADLDALGRIGDALREPALPPRRRLRAVRRRVGGPGGRRGSRPHGLRVLVVVVAAVVVLWLVAAALRQDAVPVSAASATASGERVEAPAPVLEGPPGPTRDAP